MSEEVKVEVRTESYDKVMRQVLRGIRERSDEEIEKWGEDSRQVAGVILKQIARNWTGQEAESISFEKGSLRGILRARDPGKASAAIEFGRKRTAPSVQRPHLVPAAVIARDNMMERIRGKGIVKK